MKKRVSIQFIALFISLIFGVTASWLIIKPNESKAPEEYFPYEIDAEYESYYNGQNQDIEVKYEENVPSNELTFEYSKYVSKDQPLIELDGKPKYPGIYLVRVLRTYEKEVSAEIGTSVVEVTEVISTVKFEIFKRPVKVEAKEVSIYFGQLSTAVELEYEVEEAVEGSNSGLIEGDKLETDDVKVSVDYNLFDNCGKYDINITGLDNPNYEISYVLDDKFIVKQLEIGFIWGAGSSTIYNGKYQLPEIESYYLAGDCADLTDVDVNAAISHQSLGLLFNTSNEKGEINAAEYNISYSSFLNGDNFSMVGDPGGKEFTITPKEVDLTWNNSTCVLGGASTNGFIYDGQYHFETAIINAGQICQNEETETLDECLIQYSNGVGNIDASSYTSTITALSNTNYTIKTIAEGNSSDSYSKDYTIHPKKISLTWNSSSFISLGVSYNGFEFDGQYHFETASINAGELCVNVLTNALDECLIQYSNEVGNIDASSYTSTITALSNDNYEIETISAGNASDSYSKDYVIHPRLIVLTWSETEPSFGYYSYTYDAESHMPTAVASNNITARADGQTEDLGFGYVDENPKVNANYCNSTDANTLQGFAKYYSTVTITSTNHKLPTNYSYEYKIIQKEVGVTWSDTEMVYGGKSKQYLPTATVAASDIPAKDLEGKTANDAVGLEVTGNQTNANYAYDYDKNEYVILEGDEYNYVAKATIKNTNYKYRANANAGIQTVDASESGNIVGTVETIDTYDATTTFNILPKAVGVSIDSYGEEKPMTFSFARTATQPVFDQTIYFMYNALDFTPTASFNEEDVFDGDILKVSIELLVEGSDVIYTTLRNVGVYSGRTTKIDDTNYRIDVVQSVEVTVVPAPVTIKWQEEVEFNYNSNYQVPYATVYEGVYDVDKPYIYVETSGAKANANADKDGNIFGDTYTSHVEVNEYGEFVVSSHDGILEKNYYIENTGECTTEYIIKQVELKVDALPETIIYGDAPNKTPLLEATSTNTANILLTGLQENDTIDSLTGLSRAVTYEQYNNVTGLNNASYTSTWEGITNTNYYYTYNEVTYTVNPRPVKIDWSYPRLVYNNQDQAATAVISNLARTADICNVTVDEYKDAGTGYISNVLSLSNDNYTIDGGSNLTSVAYDIEQRPLCINWKDLELVYASSIAKLFPVYEIINLASDHDEDVLNLTLTGQETFANFNSNGRINANDYFASLALNNSNYRWATAADLNVAEYEITDQSVMYVDNHTNIGYKIYALEIRVGWEDVDFTYNGTHLEPSVANISRADGRSGSIYAEDASKVLYGADQIAVTSESTVTNFVAGKWAGTHIANLTLAGDLAYNYEVVDGETTEYVIKPKPLKVSADDKNYIVYGSKVAADGYGYTVDTTDSFVQGESFATYGETITYSYGGYEQFSDVGQYDITINEVELNNYTITYVDATLTVKPLVVSLAWENVNKYTYDAEKHAPVATISNIARDEDAQYVNVVTSEFIDAANYTSEATSLTGDRAHNYTLVAYDSYVVNNKVSHEFTIEPKEIEVNWLDSGIYTYNSTNQTIGVELINGTIYSRDTVSLSTVKTVKNANADLNGVLFDTVEKEYNAVASLTGTGATNYKITNSYDYIIKQAPVTITWKNTLLTYSGQTVKQQAAIDTVTGIYNSEVEAVVSSEGNANANVTALDAYISDVVYTSTAKLNNNTNNNYAIETGIDCEYQIVAKKVSFVWPDNLEFKWTGTIHMPTPTVDTADLFKDANGNYDECIPTVKAVLETDESTYVDPIAKAKYYAVVTSLSNTNYQIDYSSNYTTLFEIRTWIIVIIINGIDILYGDAINNIINPKDLANNNFTYTIKSIEDVDNEADLLPTFNSAVTSGLIQGSIKLNNNYSVTSNVGDYEFDVDTEYENTLVSEKYEFRYEINSTNGVINVDKRPLTITLNNANVYYGNDLEDGGYGYTVTSTNKFMNNESLESLFGTIPYTFGEYSKTSVAGVLHKISIDDIESLSNYDIELVDGTLTVDKRPITLTANNNDVIYGDNAVHNNYEVTSEYDFVNGDNLTNLGITLEYNYGTYKVDSNASTTHDITITPFELANYDVTFEAGKLTVKPRPITIELVDGNVTYGDVAQGNGYSVTSDYKFANNESLESLFGTIPYTFGEYAVTSNAGTTHTISIANIASLTNYEISLVNAELTVDRRDITITLTAGNVIYGNQLVSTGYGYTSSDNGFVNNESLETLFTNGIPYTFDDYSTTTNVGSDLDISIPESELAKLTNYNISLVEAKLTVDKRPVTLTVNNHTVYYGDEAANAGYIESGLGFVNGDTLSSLGVSLEYKYGEYDVESNASTTHDITITPFELSNYDVTLVKGTLSVAKRPITLTANNNTVVYGDVATHNDYSITSGEFVNDQSLTTLGVSLVYTYGTYTVKSNATTTHDIIITPFELANYAVTFNNGTLTVEKRDITITLNNANVTYGNSAVANGYSVSGSGFANSETLESLFGTVPYTFGSYSKSSAAGSEFDISVQNIESTLTNYNVTLEEATLTVVKRNITVTPNDNAVWYGDNVTNTEYTVSGDGLANSETIESLGVTVGYTYGGYTVTTGAGNVLTISINSFTLSNYNVTLGTGKLTVVARPITIKANDVDVIYGEEVAANGYDVTSIIDFVNGDTLESLGVTVGYSFAEYDKNVGTHNNVISINSFTLDNYAVTLETGSVTIKQRSITITLNDNTVTYGDAATAAGYTIGGLGLANEETLEGLFENNIPYTFGSYTVKSNANTTHAISLDVASLTNYAVTLTTGTLTVEKRTLTVTFVGANALTYNASEQSPITIGNVVNSDTVKVTYNRSIKDAGTYNGITFEIDNTNYRVDSNVISSFTIAKAKLTLSANPSFYYIAEGDKLGTLEINKTNVSLSGLYGSDKATLSYQIVYLADGINAESTLSFGSAGTNLTTSYTDYAKIVMSINNSNYYLETAEVTPAITVAAVAQIGTTYYGTVYEAINAANNAGSGVIRTVCTTATEYKNIIPTLTVPTEEQVVTINSGVTLMTPYTNAETTISKNKGSVTPSSKDLYSKLLIPNGVTVTLKGTLSAAANVYSTGAHQEYSVIMNNGIINASSATINAYGYIKGTGEINLNNSTLHDIFTIYDWPGGGNGKVMADNNIIPFKSYSFHNNSCKTIIDSTSTYTALVLIEASVVGLVENLVTLVGKSAADKDVGILFKINSGYVIKSVETPLNPADTFNSDYYATNQSTYQREVIDVYGNVTDSSIHIERTIWGMGINIQTGVGTAMPLGFINVKFMSGTSTLSTNSYKFLPGSRLYVGKDATLNINNVHIMIYDEFKEEFTYSGEGDPTYNGRDFKYGYIHHHTAWFDAGREDEGSQFIVDGTLECKGFIAGEIKGSKNGNGKITLSNISATMREVAQLTYGSGGTSTVTPDDVTYYLKGTFDGVYTSDGTGIKTGYTYIYDNVNKTWARPLTISFVTNVDNQSKDPIIINNGSLGYIIPNYEHTLTKEHYTFDGWYLDSSYKTPAVGNTVYTNTTLYAKWNINKYTVSFNSNDGTAVDSIIVNEGETYGELPIPTREGYLFAGWTHEGNPIDSNTIVTITSDHILDANWIEKGNTCNVILYVDGDEYNVVEVNIGSTISKLDTPIKSGYSFDGWYTDEACTSKFDMATTIESEMPLYGKFVANQYTITFDSNGGSSVTSITADYESNVTAPSDPTKEGHKFTDWYTDPECTNQYTFSKMPLNGITLYAGWEIQQYSITFNLGDGGKFNDDNSTSKTITQDYGTPVSIPAYTANDKYTFKAWDKEVPATMPAKNMTITANWNKDSGGCVAAGTLITMADGTYKKVEDIVAGDYVLVFNHETGELDVSLVMLNAHDSLEWSEYEIINLVFSDGSTIKVINEHTFFNTTLNEYVIITKNSVNNYINTNFYSVGINGERNDKKLVDVFISIEYTGIYNPLTYYHMNCFTNDLLTMPGEIEGLINIFEYDDDLKYNDQSMKENIELYGLYEYEDLNEYFTKEVFDSLPMQYVKIVVEKGIVELKDVVDLINRYKELIEDSQKN